MLIVVEIIPLHLHFIDINYSIDVSTFTNEKNEYNDF